MPSLAPPPSVSIVMPCFNAGQHLPRSLASVRAQTLADWELIVVDDGSTDGSAHWLAPQAEPRLRLLQRPHQGASAARNSGIDHARGEYIAFLDADDTWAPDFLQRLRAALLDRPDAVLAYCGWQKFGVPAAEAKPFVPPDYETPDKRTLLFAACRWPIHAALARRAPLLDCGGFPTHLQNAEDYALWLELATRGPIVRVPEVLAQYHFHGSGQASAHRARAALQLLDAQHAYLARHPDFARSLGPDRRRMPYQGLLRAGFAAYWARDLPAARTLFRRALRAGYGRPAQWRYMLPALLPLRLHAALLALRARSGETRPD